MSLLVSSRKACGLYCLSNNTQVVAQEEREKGGVKKPRKEKIKNDYVKRIHNGGTAADGNMMKISSHAG